MVVCKVGIRGMSTDSLEGLVFVNDIRVGIFSSAKIRKKPEGLAWFL
jgi:hypothetical protein